MAKLPLFVEARRTRSRLGDTQMGPYCVLRDISGGFQEVDCSGPAPCGTWSAALPMADQLNPAWRTQCQAGGAPAGGGGGGGAAGGGGGGAQPAPTVQPSPTPQTQNAPGATPIVTTAPPDYGPGQETIVFFFPPGRPPSTAPAGTMAPPGTALPPPASGAIPVDQATRLLDLLTSSQDAVQKALVRSAASDASSREVAAGRVVQGCADGLAKALPDLEGAKSELKAAVAAKRPAKITLAQTKAIEAYAQCAQAALAAPANPPALSAALGVGIPAALTAAVALIK